MNDSLYEDYMRSVLGYQPMNNYQNTYDMNYDNLDMSTIPTSATVPTMANMQTIPSMSAMSNIQIQELENCYPDIYRIIYPMIQRTCERNTRAITKEAIDSMTDEIYFAIDDNMVTENRGNDSKEIKDTKLATSSNSKTEEREDRQRIV